MMHKKCVFCPIVQNFLLVGPYLQRIIFWPQWPLPITLTIWVLWPPWNFWRLKICLPTFRPMSIMAKQLDGLGYYLVCRYASAQAALLDGDPASPRKGAQQPPLALFGPCLPDNCHASSFCCFNFKQMLWHEPLWNRGVNPGKNLWCSSLFFPFTPPPLLLRFFHSFPSLPLEVGPLNPTMGSGEHCKLPQWGLGQSPSQNWIWCILALKSHTWWQQFSWESTDQISCILNSKLRPRNDL